MSGKVYPEDGARLLAFLDSTLRLESLKIGLARRGKGPLPLSLPADIGTKVLGGSRRYRTVAAGFERLCKAGCNGPGMLCCAWQFAATHSRKPFLPLAPNDTQIVKRSARVISRLLESPLLNTKSHSQASSDPFGQLPHMQFWLLPRMLTAYVHLLEQAERCLQGMGRYDFERYFAVKALCDHIASHTHEPVPWDLLAALLTGFGCMTTADSLRKTYARANRLLGSAPLNPLDS